jgi:SAM-dependent methyltransferase
MGRLHLLELEDQPWFPDTWRRFAVDHLSFVEELVDAYRPLTGIARELLEQAPARRLVDLCAGAGAAPSALARALAREGEGCEVVLTDLFPNLAAFRERAREPGVSFEAAPVDATAVPAHLVGVRTLFNALHHLPPAAARGVLQDAAERRQPLLVVESVGRTFSGVVLVALITLGALALPAFVRPFSWRRLAYSWLFPVVPFVVLFDGLVSCLRVYSPAELRALTAGLDDGYAFEVRRVRMRGLPLSHLVLMGRPR